MIEILYRTTLSVGSSMTNTFAFYNKPGGPVLHFIRFLTENHLPCLHPFALVSKTTASVALSCKTDTYDAGLIKIENAYGWVYRSYRGRQDGLTGRTDDCDRLYDDINGFDYKLSHYGYSKTYRGYRMKWLDVHRRTSPTNLDYLGQIRIDKRSLHHFTIGISLSKCEIDQWPADLPWKRDDDESSTFELLHHSQRSFGFSVYSICTSDTYRAQMAQLSSLYRQMIDIIRSRQ